MKHFLLALALALPLGCFAQTVHPIDKACEDCLARAEADPSADGAPGPARACWAIQERQWNAELARLIALDKRHTAKQEQAEWMLYRNASLVTWKKARGIKNEADASMGYRDELREQRVNLVRARVTALASILAKKR